MAGRVEGKVALVTGGAMGLGRADCMRLAEEGAKVVLTDIDLARAQAVADEVGGHAYQHDVRDEARWVEIIGEVERLHGRLDVLVNNAGNVIFESVEDCSTDNFRLHMAIHVEGTFFGCKHGIGLMKTTGGSIVNMSSTASLMGYGNIVAYTAAKGAIRSMTKSIAMHCQDKGYGIRCNALMPGGIDTPMVRGILPDPSVPSAGAAGALPAEALGHPRDVANMVLYLASDESRFLTGLEIPIDNGLYARPHH